MSDVQQPTAAYVRTSASQDPATKPSGVASPAVGSKQASRAEQHPLISNQRFLELVVNHGRLERRLGEIDVTSIGSDGQLFHQIKAKYESVRGHRAKFKLMRPASIRFVQVT